MLTIRSTLSILVFSAQCGALFGASVSFIGTDTATQGTWKGVYGGDGYVIPATGTAGFQHLPTYATVTPANKLDFLFNGGTADVRALQKPGGLTDRLCGCWYADSTFDVDIVIAGTQPRRVSFYCVDFDSAARAQRIEVIDTGNNSVLDTRNIAAPFNAGVWLSWNVSGSVKFRFTDTGTPNTVLNGIFFGGTSFGGSIDTIWFDDALPPGVTVGGDYAWSFVTSNPAPYSGTASHQSTVAANTHQHFFTGANPAFRINKGDRLISYVYLDPANPPTEIMMQWNDGVWDHRAFWGADSITFGTTATVSRRFMGTLPPTGQWVRLEVPAGLVGLEDRDLNGIAFTIFGGRATWDHPGKTTPANLTVSPTNPAINFNSMVQFTASLTTLTGLPLVPQTPLSFNASGGGTINATGLFTSNSTPGTYNLTVSGTNGTISAATNYTVFNAPPVANGDSVNVTQNRARIVAAPGVLGNDTDLENDPLTAVKDTDPSSGTLVFNANGSFTYTPNTGFIGMDSFTYHASDAFNNSTVVTVTLNVTPNQAPVISSAAVQITSEDTAFQAGFSASDPNGDPITYFIATPPSLGTVTIPNPNVLQYLYAPNPDATGTDTFTLGAQDDSGAVGTFVVSVVIQPINDAPTAGSVQIQTGNNIAFTGTLQGSDVDTAVLSFTVTALPTYGTILLDTSTGAFTYTPDTDYVGTDSFTFRVDDGQTTSALATVSILVTPGPAFASSPLLTPNPALAGQSVSGSVSVPAAVAITWDWGDGSTGSGPFAAHTWTTSGVYTVRVFALGADGVTSKMSIEMLVGATLDGDTGTPGAATPPGVVGILVGGNGAGAAVKGSGKVVCNYVRREKTTYSGSLEPLALPAGLKQADLAGLTATLKIGPLAAPAVFRFDLNAKGKGRATGLPQVELNLKKRRFRFKATRTDLTELTEALGGVREFIAVEKNATMLVPVTLQVGTKVALAMTFQVNYKQINGKGVGTLAK